MATLNFREIPEANKPSGEQDAFEMFARELLTCLGFKVVQKPSRGADGGKDLVVEETRTGLIDSTKIRWMVSCKHFAHCGRSVSPDDERNVLERVGAANCQGFLDFYSTIPSSGLSEMLHRQSSTLVKLFDHSEIERYLLCSSGGRELIKRYFPISVKKLQHEPAELFEDAVQIECECCGKNLLKPPSGIWVRWRAVPEQPSTDRRPRFVDFHFACKGQCDNLIAARVRERHSSVELPLNEWDDISDMSIPTVFIDKVMRLLNGLYAGNQYDPEPFDKVKCLLLGAFPSLHAT